jgi:DNA-binding NarL/FixJ family response regulator
MATAKTEIPTIAIFDGLTGETIIREMTAEEIAQREADAAEAAAAKAAIEAKVTARASALAKLAELGLTQEEIAAL